MHLDTISLIKHRAFSAKSKELSAVTPAYLGIARELCLYIEDANNKDNVGNNYVFSMGAITLMK